MKQTQISDFNIANILLKKHSYFFLRLFALSEIVGGVFLNGYPGESSLTSGAVFCPIAGQSAAFYSK
jgi:hypothetical protein